MTRRLSIDLPLNRVEGDLEVRIEIEDGAVADAFCSGTLYRGFERLLAGRGALDGLVLTPRICGICTTAHLTAASRALDAVSGATVPPDGQRIRNIALMTEHVQSDVRHTFLMFAADLAHETHASDPHHAEALRRYEPFRGTAVGPVIRETRKLLEVVAILGGQWPHSSFMVPGGIASLPGASDLLQCRLLVRGFREWYERSVLGCSLERFREVRSAADLDAWLAEGDAQRESELGFFVRYARSLGLDRLGASRTAHVSFGSLDLPAGSAVAAPDGGPRLVPAGVFAGGRRAEFDAGRIAEDVACSWYRDDGGARHPSAGVTEPYASGHEGRKYSWAKAPRYDGLPAETGPLSEALAAGDPLFTDLSGTGVFARELARLTRPARLLPAIEAWLDEVDVAGPFYASPGPISDGEGFGLCQAARGALGHWVGISGGAIEHYQIITPTAWNASPRDAEGRRGPIEEALVGTPVENPERPVGVWHVVRSFDPCLVCTVHSVRRGRVLGRSRVGERG